MSRNAWISAGKISAAVAALALVLGAIFQGQAQQRSDMADVRAELRNGLADVRAELRSGLGEVNVRIDGLSRDLADLRERVARIEGHLALPPKSRTQASATPRAEQGG